MEFDPKTFRIESSRRSGTIPLVIGIVGLALSLIGYLVDPKQFFFSYLTAFTFWCTLGLGGLFFVMVHYLTNSTWSVVLRRLAENIMYILPVLAIFAIPVLLGIGDLYHWSHHNVVQSDHILKGKSGYLNVPFFVIRVVIYFAVWVVLSRHLYRLSLRQDREGDESTQRRATKASAPGMILFAVTISFFSFDLIMSLDPHWYSTIFGAYIFSGSYLGMLSLLTVYLVMLKSKNVLNDAVTSEHFRDLGKLIFAFIIFWGYMAFSQYLLIWYANIPEETQWFLSRWVGSWKAVSLVLVFGHFVIPFFVLFPMEIKKNLPVMLAVGIWMLFMHWVDIYWLVMPTLHDQGVHISWIDPVTMLGIGGIFLWRFIRLTVSQPLVPVNDPRLKQSMEITS